ncbi:hypothetical protein JAAARDRAFT_533722 [Jaapia argillacea MUCL 33604]|uniref:Zinc-finger domain-containing protein n=1 Tax=Jaapia argillacea MUCL 33604 TaxID=933084 RepID=A0A067PLP0_9AGAM|nr:hypothetical protein JAAARDRAFT_533722 [Jaapia argillacea MUCL 33604]
MAQALSRSPSPLFSEPDTAIEPVVKPFIVPTATPSLSPQLGAASSSSTSTPLITPSSPSPRENHPSQPRRRRRRDIPYILVPPFPPGRSRDDYAPMSGADPRPKVDESNGLADALSAAFSNNDTSTMTGNVRPKTDRWEVEEVDKPLKPPRPKQQANRQNIRKGRIRPLPHTPTPLAAPPALDETREIPLHISGDEKDPAWFTLAIVTRHIRQLYLERDFEIGKEFWNGITYQTSTAPSTDPNDDEIASSQGVETFPDEPLSQEDAEISYVDTESESLGARDMWMETVESSHLPMSAGILEHTITSTPSTPPRTAEPKAWMGDGQSPHWRTNQFALHSDHPIPSTSQGPGSMLHPHARAFNPGANDFLGSALSPTSPSAMPQSSTSHGHTGSLLHGIGMTSMADSYYPHNSTTSYFTHADDFVSNDGLSLGEEPPASVEPTEDGGYIGDGTIDPTLLGGGSWIPPNMTQSSPHDLDMGADMGMGMDMGGLSPVQRSRSPVESPPIASSSTRVFPLPFIPKPSRSKATTVSTRHKKRRKITPSESEYAPSQPERLRSPNTIVIPGRRPRPHLSDDDNEIILDCDDSVYSPPPPPPPPRKPVKKSSVTAQDSTETPFRRITRARQSEVSSDNSSDVEKAGEPIATVHSGLSATLAKTLQHTGYLTLPKTAQEETACHHCRRSTYYEKMRCTKVRNGSMCGLRYCVNCITKR